MMAGRLSFDFSGVVAIVTGGAGGIGRMIAERLAGAGARVLVVDTNCSNGAEVLRAIEHAGGEAAFVEADESQPESAERAVDRASELWGGIDVLVNSAGQYPFAPALETSNRLWQHVMDVNLKGGFLFSRAVATHMRGMRKQGSIVNVGSIHAHVPMVGFAAYGAAKAGLTMLTRALAAELGPFGIRVNSVSPGGIVTPGSREAGDAVALAFGTTRENVVTAYEARVPLRRMGDPEDVAAAVLFLASGPAKYVTGADLIIDGGYSLS